MKISFDYDMTLSEPHIRELAKLLIKAGADVWVLTSRQDDYIRDENGAILGTSSQNSDLYQVIKYLEIPKNKVIYTNGAFKQGEYARGGFDLHFDDMWDEVEMINRNGGKALLVDMQLYDMLHLINCNDIEKTYFDG